MNKSFLIFVLLQVLLYITSTSANAIGSLQGTYKPDGKCVPSSTCCCSTGTTTISSEPPNTSVTVSGSLDGGSGCRGFNSLGAVFSVVDSTTATWTVPVYGDKYAARASADYASIVVQRTDINNPNCINNLSRVSGSAVPAGSGSATTTTPPANTNTNTNTGTTTTTPTTPTTTNPTTTAPTTTPTVTATDALSQANVGNGNFQATATPLIMTAGSKEGAYQVDTSHLIRFGVLKTTSDGDQYDMWLVLEPSSTLFSAAVRGEWATLHYISPTTDSADTAVMASPINVPMVVQDGATSARQWKYSTVRVPNGLGMRFSFSYKMVDGTAVTHTPTFYFPAGGTAPSTTTAPTGATTPTPSSSSSSTPTKSRSERWAGTYKVDPTRCTQSSSCCCAERQIVAKILPGNNDQITLDAHLDGSGTCGGMTDVTGDFVFVSDTVATFSYPDSPLVMTAELSTDGQTIMFSNSVYECKSYAIKTNAAAQTSSSRPTNSGMSRYESFLGEWRSDKSCKPSANCCCVSGSMYVMTPSNAVKLPNYVPPDNAEDLNDPNALYAYGYLDGGVACFRRTEMSGVCIIENDNYGSCMLEGIQFNATRNGQMLTITNSMYQNCESRVVYAGGKTSSDAPPKGRAMGLLTYVLLGVATIAVYAWAIRLE